MARNSFTPYEKLVFISYGFYLLLALTWLLMNILMGGFLNYYALFTIVVFGVQVYYRHKLTNLILGLLLFALSVFFTLQFLYMGSKTGFDLFVNVMLGCSIASIIMAGILIFSYTKLSFQDQP